MSSISLWKCLLITRGQRRKARLIGDERKAALIAKATGTVHSRYAEDHLWPHKMSNLEADGLQLQKTTWGATPVIWEPDAEATIPMGSPKLDNGIFENITGLMGLDFSCNIWMTGSEFYCRQHGSSCLLFKVQAVDGLMVQGTYCWNTSAH